MVAGALLLGGTGSDVGKSVIVAGICRWLARQGVKVAPFKAQNMALNSGVTADGGEIGRAQVAQAAAAGIEAEVAMNPVLLKPTGERSSQVVVMGRPAFDVDALSYRDRTEALRPIVLDALADLRSRFDVVVCEGAGSVAEINLRTTDLANMGLARAAGLPTVIAGDIDRGGVFAALYGCLALLDDADAALVQGFLINRFRGDRRVLDPGIVQLTTLTDRPTIGVLPHVDGLWLDAEDSLALDAAGWARGGQGIDVAVVRLPRISNYTDVDALAAEPDVAVTFTTNPAAVARADLAIVPGSKATVPDLDWLRRTGIADALLERAGAGRPVLGICGGYQMLGTRIDDEVESGAGTVDGLGLLPVTTTFAPDKHLARPSGHSTFLDADASGYEIRHGRVQRYGGAPLIEPDEGCVAGPVLGTSWHGLLEGDALRSALLRWAVGERQPSGVRFADVRETRLDRLADLIAEHTDTDALVAILERA